MEINSKEALELLNKYPKKEDSNNIYSWNEIYNIISKLSISKI